MLAIALQLVLTFGHVHPLPAAAAIAQQVEAPHQSIPGSGDELGGDCAICGSIAAFSTLDIPHAETDPYTPRLLPGETLKPRSVDASVTLAAFPPFNSRAPPSA